MHFILKHFTFNYSSCLSRSFKIWPVDTVGQSKVRDRRDVWKITIAHADTGVLAGRGWVAEEGGTRGQERWLVLQVGREMGSCVMGISVEQAGKT